MSSNNNSITDEKAWEATLYPDEQGKPKYNREKVKMVADTITHAIDTNSRTRFVDLCFDKSELLELRKAVEVFNKKTGNKWTTTICYWYGDRNVVLQLCNSRI